MYEVATYFVSGILTGMGMLWGYWKAIPAKKKKAAFKEVISSMEDGKLTVSEGLNVIDQLI